MANRWTTAEPVITAIIAALAGVDVVGWGWLPTHHGVYASLTWGPGDYVHNCNNDQDWQGQINVRLAGPNSEKLLDVVDLLAVCFLGAANRASLAAVSVPALIAETSDPPIVFTSGKGNYIVDVLFSITIGKTY
jgi:hypothetical protein